MIKYFSEMDWKAHLETLGEELARLVVSFVAVVALNMLLLTAVRAAWVLYGDTGVGKHFKQSRESLSGQLDALVSLPTFDFALDVTLYVFGFILITAVVMQFFCVRHYLYSSLPFYGKLLWAAVLAFFIAGEIQAGLEIAGWGIVYAFTLASVLCLLPACLTVCSQLIPDVVTTSVRTVEWVNDRLSR